MTLPEELKGLLNKVVKSIDNPTNIVEKGGKPIKSILLYGPPGTGKTTFAKAIAKEFPDSRFASLDVTRLGSKFVGETEKNIQAAVNEMDLAYYPDQQLSVLMRFCTPDQAH